MIFCIDNGHGINTAGKQSVDGSLKEYAWAREVAQRVAQKLNQRGYEARLITPEIQDTDLRVRVRRVNNLCDTFGAENCCVVSIHVNASGYGKFWMPAQGWSVYCSNGKSGKVSSGSERLADCFYDEAAKLGRKMLKERPNKSYWVKSLAICRDTKCPAVLTENFFMTNKDDLRYLLSAEGTEAIVNMHVDALIKYADK